MWSKPNIVLVSMVATCVVFVAAGAALWWFAAHTFTLNLSGLDFEPLMTSAKAAAAGLVVAKQPSSSKAQAAPPPGYLVAYEHNPGGFKADAKLFDTWLTAVELATSTLDHGTNGNWVKNSAMLDFVKPEYRTDPWGHSLCVMRRGDAILVISGGPSAPGSPICKNVSMTVEDLRKFPRGKLLQSQSGSLVLVATKGDPKSSQAKN